MTNEKGQVEKDNYYLMVKPPSRRLGMEFKSWCKANKVSMNKAFGLLMRQVVKGNFRVQQVIREKS